MSNEALIIVDMQVFFLDDKNPSELDQALKVQREMIDHFMENNFPLVYLAYLSGDKVSPIHPFILPSNTQKLPVVYKESDDGFKETGLDELLQNLGVKKIHVTGCNADYCVKDTVRSAISKGYEVVLYPDAILAARSNPLEHHKALYEIWKDEEAKGIVSVVSWGMRKRE